MRQSSEGELMTIIPMTEDENTLNVFDQETTKRMTVQEFIDNYEPGLRTIQRPREKDVHVPGLVAILLLDLFVLILCLGVF